MCDYGKQLAEGVEGALLGKLNGESSAEDGV